MRLPLNLSNTLAQSTTLTTKDSQPNASSQPSAYIVNPYITSPYPPNSHQLPVTYHLDSSNNHQNQPHAQHQKNQQQQHHFGALLTKSTDSINPAASSTDDALVDAKPIKRNNSLISFKSLDFNFKTIYSNIKQKHKDQQQGRTNSTGSAGGSTVGSKNDTTSSSKTSISRTPYVRVETVDRDESQENLLINYLHSPFMNRGSFDKSSTSGSQFLSATGCNLYPDYRSSESHGTTPSSFLTISSPPNVRRSSTSDICDTKKTLTTSVSQPTSNPTSEASRRPSTSDLLRRARERKGNPEAASKIGRSVSHGGMPRGGRGGRRTSMAF